MNLKATLWVSLASWVLLGGLIAIVLSTDSAATFDQLIQSGVVAYRSAQLDQVMVLVTRLGDSLYAALLNTMLVLLLGFHRKWWQALHLVAVALAVGLSVTVMKTLLARERPNVLLDGLSPYSFPSGHTANAAIAFGALALILAHCYRHSPGGERYSWLRRIIWIVTALVVTAVGVSRVYLQVHWPTDTLASILLATPFLLAFAWQLHQMPPLKPRWTPWFLLLAPMAIYLIMVVFTGSTSGLYEFPAAG